MLKQIEGFEDYFISDTGDVYSNKRSKLKKLKLSSVHGHLHITLSKPGQDLRTLYVHRLVAQAFIPNPENKPCVNHINGDKKDNRVENLEWCTNEENTRHFYQVQKPNDMYNPLSDEEKERRRQYYDKNLKERAKENYKRKKKCK